MPRLSICSCWTSALVCLALAWTSLAHQATYYEFPLINGGAAVALDLGNDIWSSIEVDFDQPAYFSLAGICPPVPSSCATESLAPCCPDCMGTPDPTTISPNLTCICPPGASFDQCVSSTMTNFTITGGVRTSLYVPFVPWCHNVLITFKARTGISTISGRGSDFPLAQSSVLFCANDTLANQNSFGGIFPGLDYPKFDGTSYSFELTSILSDVALDIEIRVADDAHPDFLLPLDDYFHLNPLSRNPLTCNGLQSALTPLPTVDPFAIPLRLVTGGSAIVVGNITRAEFSTKSGYTSAAGVTTYYTNLRNCPINITSEWLDSTGAPFTPATVTLVERTPSCDGPRLPSALADAFAALDKVKYSKVTGANTGAKLYNLFLSYAAVGATLALETLPGCLAYASSFGSFGAPVTVTTVDDQIYCDPNNATTCCQSYGTTDCCLPQRYDVQFAPWTPEQALVGVCASPTCARQAVNDLSSLLQPTFKESCRSDDLTSIPFAIDVIDQCRIAYQSCFRNDLKKCNDFQSKYFGCSNISHTCSNATKLAFVTCTLAATDPRLLPTLAVSVGATSASVDQLAAALLANFSRPGCADLTDNSIFSDFKVTAAECADQGYSCNWRHGSQTPGINCSAPYASDYCADPDCPLYWSCQPELSQFAVCFASLVDEPDCANVGGVIVPADAAGRSCAIAGVTTNAACNPPSICAANEMQYCYSACVFTTLTDSTMCDCSYHIANPSSPLYDNCTNATVSFLYWDTGPINGPICRYGFGPLYPITKQFCDSFDPNWNATWVRAGTWQPAGNYTTKAECEASVCYRPGVLLPTVPAIDQADCESQQLCSVNCTGCDGNNTACVTLGGSCSDISKLTQDDCYLYVACSDNRYASYNACINCSGETWGPRDQWYPASSGQGVWKQRGVWTPRASIITTQWGLQFDYDNYTLNFVNAYLVALSVVLQNKIICTQLAPLSAAVQLLCSCGSGVDPASCSTNADPLLGLAYLCTGNAVTYSTPPVSFTAPASNTYVGYLCTTALVYVLPAGQFYQQFVPLYSSWFLSIIGDNPWAVIPNSQNVAVGQIVGDGVTIDLGLGDMQGTFYLCLGLRSDIPISQFYTVADFAAFNANTSTFTVLESADAAITNNGLCGTIRIQSGVQSFIPIMRTRNYKSQKLESSLTSKQKNSFLAGAVIYGLCFGIALLRLLSMGAFVVLREYKSLLQPIGVMALLTAFFCIRMIYFILVPKGKLVDVPQIIDSLLAELPTYLFLSTFSVLVVWWMRIYYSGTLAIGLALFNAGMYVALIVIVAVYASRNRPTTGKVIDCEVVRVGSPDTTLTKIYKCIIAGISFLLALGFLAYGGLILVKIWEALTERWSAMAKFISLVILAPLGLIGQCILLLYSTFSSPNSSSSDTVTAITVQILVEVLPIVPLFFSVRNTQLDKAAWMADIFGLWVCTGSAPRSSSTSSTVHETEGDY